MLAALHCVFQPRRASRPLWPAILLAAVPLLLCACGAASHAASQRSALDGVTPSGLSAPGFELRDQHGQLVRLADERGRDVVVTFLYVHCPDVCPIIAGQLNEALHELGPRRDDVRVLAVSVDPTGDTPRAVHHFIAVHRLLPQFLYLTGSASQLEPIWHGYHVAATKVRGKLVVGHTAISLLLDPDGRPRAVYDSHVTAAEVVHDLHALGLAS